MNKMCSSGKCRYHHIQAICGLNVMPYKSLQNINTTYSVIYLQTLSAVACAPRRKSLIKAMFRKEFAGKCSFRASHWSELLL